MRALREAIVERKKLVNQQPKTWTAEQRDRGEDKAARRLDDELQAWEREYTHYTGYLEHLRALLNFQLNPTRPFRSKISGLIPELALGDNNDVWDLQNYVAGASPHGLVLDAAGKLDEQRSFIHVDHFPLLARQRARNNPQPAVSSRPIDFIAMRLPDSAGNSSDAGRPGAAGHAYWLYGDEDAQLVILTDRSGRISVKPIQRLTQDQDGKIAWLAQDWRAGLPLRLFEDQNLHLPPGADRAGWLSKWHTEREWLEAIHLCRYSNGVISVVEYLSPVADNVPGPPGMSPILVHFERRRRELVQADFHIFAADHWNFNARNFNPGGNHGSFLRISTHSVWMMAGPGVPVETIEEPYDSLNFASTVLALVGRPAPMPDRVVNLR